MKSLFKRTIAAASSSVLVLSQLATLAANVNVSAADAAPLNIDKKFVLDVPIDEKDPLKAGQVSDWDSKAEICSFLQATKRLLEVQRRQRRQFVRRLTRLQASTARFPLLKSKMSSQRSLTPLRSQQLLTAPSR